VCECLANEHNIARHCTKAGIVLQTCDYLGDSEGFVSEAREFAMRCRRSLTQPRDIHALSCALLSMQRRQQHAVLAELAAVAPFNTVLLALPALLRQPLLEVMLQRDSNGDNPQLRDAANSSFDVDAPTEYDAFQAGGIVMPLTSRACEVLTAQLPALPQLQRFSAQNHRLTDESLAAGVAALRMHTQLTWLNISGNEASTMTAHSLSIALPLWRQLQHLRITGDEKVDEAALLHMSNSLSLLSELQSLHIGGEPEWARICSTALASLTGLCSLDMAASQAAYLALHKLSLLTKLAMEGVDGNDLADTTKPLAEALSSLTKLRWLSLEAEADSALTALPGSRLTELQHLHLLGFAYDSQVAAVELDSIPDAQGAAPVPLEQGHTHGLRSIANMVRLTYLCLGRDEGEYGVNVNFVQLLGRLVFSLPALCDFRLLTWNIWAESGGYEHMCCAWAHACNLSMLHFTVMCDASRCSLPQLKEVNLSVSCVDSSKHALSIASMTSLTALTLGGAYDWSETGSELRLGNAARDRILLNACVQLRGLQRIELHDMSLHTSSEALMHLCTQLTLLRTLSLNSCSLPANWSWLQSLGPHVRKLVVERCCCNQGCALCLGDMLRSAARAASLQVVEVDLQDLDCDVRNVVADLLRTHVRLFRWLQAPSSVHGVEVQPHVSQFNENWLGDRMIMLL
jgi:hypothetical protein